jgi:hypothetical protein
MNIKEFLNQEDKSGKLSKEKWLIVNNEEAYKTIIDYSNNNFLNDIPFKEKIYLYIHDLNNKPICKNKNCSTHTKFVNKTIGYLDYCSNKCQSSSDEIMNKRKNTNIERYGVEHAIYNKEKNEKFLDKIRNRTEEEQENINNKRIETNIKNFGFDNPNKNPKFIEKRVQSFKENIESFKESYKKTSLEKYGVEHPWMNKEIYKKSERTNEEKYGVKYPMKNEDVKKNNLKTQILKYGKLFVQTNEFKEKYKKTSLEKYGVETPMKIEEIKNKIISTQIKKYGKLYIKTDEYLEKKKKRNLEKYGVEDHMLVECIKNKSIENQKKAKLELFLLNNKDLNFDVVECNSTSLLIKCDICSEYYNITKSLFHNRRRDKTILCTKCNDPLDNKISSFHIEVLNHIKSFYSGEIILNDRVELKGKEIDIWIPEFRIGIECNGLYWHTESFKGKNYHKDKYNISKENNINLIQIWEDEWKYKRDIVKSRLSNKLKYTSKNIYSRKCVIKNLSSKEAKDFLNKNHLQGFLASKYYLGLYYNSKLVSLMSFGLLRIALNSKGDENDYEILRFCNCLNTNVIGSASKLFNHFIKENKPNSVISYASLEWGDGDFYSKLGMIDKGMTDIGYYYVIDGKREHRYKFTKHKLVAEGYDSNKSEYKIMLDRGYDRVWSCGNQKWIWNK